MRVISGEFGGRPLKSLPGDTTRPTTDKVKESIFNIIGPYFDGGTCIDLYAGSGGLAIEAISRGMTKAYLFENNRKAQIVIEQNIAMTKQETAFTLIKGDSKYLLSKINEPADLIFLDPPYAKQTIVEDVKRLFDLGLVKDSAIIVCETDKQTQLPDVIEHFSLWKKAQYGMTNVWIYERAEDDE